MTIYRITLAALITLAISPIAIAQVYECDGPDGPVYTDKACEPGAAQMEFAESSGVSGISDAEKADLAGKKAEREQNRTSRSNNNPTVNYQTQSTGNEVDGRWPRRVRQPLDQKPVTLPVQRPVRPVTRRRK